VEESTRRPLSVRQLRRTRSTERISWELLLAEQIAYYRALAAEYEDHALDLPGGEELLSALDAFQPEGDVLEIACGPGFWTSRLLRHATTVTSLDAASEMLAIASARVDDERVRFIQADVFSWRPDRRYDVVFFGFWLSHVPAERFESFWSLIRDCVAPHVRVPYTASELEARLSRLGWQVTVTGTSGPFYWGSGSLRAPPRAVR
jgi:2-polyprenyl-3-methyl-5-hydroxy-6-metoxy-1,4-benzoquinol methylase